MEPTRSPPLVSDANQQGVLNQGGDNRDANSNTRSAWQQFLHEYFHTSVVPRDMDVIGVDDDAPLTQHEDVDVVLALCQPGQRDCAKTQGMTSLANGELNLNLQLHYDEIHAKEPSQAIHVAPSGSRELKGVIALASPWLSTSSPMIEERTGLGLAAQPMRRTFYSENVPSAGYKMPLPPPVAGNNSKMFVAAAAADPLQLSIGTHAPAAKHMPRSASSIAFSRYTGSGINNLNLLPEKKAVAFSNNASPNLKPLYERPLLGLTGKKDHPPFAPVILESSEVAEAAADHELHEFCHGGARCKNIMAPAKANHKRRRYIWPAKEVAKLDEKTEKLRKEALLRPAHRRPMILIEKNIDELQGKKEEIHSRMLDMMREDDNGDVGGSTQQ